MAFVFWRKHDFENRDSQGWLKPANEQDFKVSGKNAPSPDSGKTYQYVGFCLGGKEYYVVDMYENEKDAADRTHYLNGGNLNGGN